MSFCPKPIDSCLPYETNLAGLRPIRSSGLQHLSLEDTLRGRLFHFLAPKEDLTSSDLNSMNFLAVVLWHSPITSTGISRKGFLVVHPKVPLSHCKAITFCRVQSQ